MGVPFGVDAEVVFEQLLVDCRSDVEKFEDLAKSGGAIAVKLFGRGTS